MDFQVFNFIKKCLGFTRKTISPKILKNVEVDIKIVQSSADLTRILRSQNTHFNTYVNNTIRDFDLNDNVEVDIKIVQSSADLTRILRSQNTHFNTYVNNTIRDFDLNDNVEAEDIDDVKRIIVQSSAHLTRILREQREHQFRRFIDRWSVDFSTNIDVEPSSVTVDVEPSSVTIDVEPSSVTVDVEPSSVTGENIVGDKQINVNENIVTSIKPVEMSLIISDIQSTGLILVTQKKGEKALVIEQYNKMYITHVLNLLKEYKNINEIPESIFRQISEDLSLIPKDTAMFIEILENFYKHSHVYNFDNPRYNYSAIVLTLNNYGISLKTHKLSNIILNPSINFVTGIQTVLDGIFWMDTKQANMLEVLDKFKNSPENLKYYYLLISVAKNHYDLDEDKARLKTMQILVNNAFNSTLSSTKSVKRNINENKLSVDYLTLFYKTKVPETIGKSDNCINTAIFKLEYDKLCADLFDDYLKYRHTLDNYIVVINKWYYISSLVYKAHPMLIEELQNKNINGYFSIIRIVVEQCNQLAPFGERQKDLLEIVKMKKDFSMESGKFWKSLHSLCKFLIDIFKD